MAAPDTFTTPNLYQLQGAGIHVTYSAGGFGGGLNLTYQDANGSQSFSDDQITVTQTPIGVVVTVTIRRTIDTGSTSFSVLIPTVNLAGPGQAAPVSHRGDHHPPPLLGHSGLRSRPDRALPGHAAERDGGAGLVLASISTDGFFILQTTIVYPESACFSRISLELSVSHSRTDLSETEVPTRYFALVFKLGLRS